MKITLLALLCLSSITICYGDDLELERQLKILNKPAVKTILTDYGAIIDCVDIKKQPAFDHPLLKNHELQLEPCHPLHNDSFQENIANFESHDCPFGTVPIRRTTKEDLIRLQNISSVADILTGLTRRSTKEEIKTSEAVSTTAVNTIVTHNAVVQVGSGDKAGIIRGASARISVNNPQCGRDQRIIGGIWLSNGVNNQLTNIMVGWTVNPLLYNDNRPRLFVSWTRDNGISTGCIDLRCPGFVLVDKRFSPGGIISDVSVFDGPQFELPISVFQEDNTKNWWLLLWSASDKNYARVGYWPKEILPLLSGGATTLYFGGTVGAPPGRPSPPMGNGHFPGWSFAKAAYISNIMFRDHANTAWVPLRNQVWAKVDRPKCYNLKDMGDVDRWSQYSILYGGPGGDCK